MSKVKFAKNIKEDNYNPLNTKNTIIDRIAKSYNENAKETKIQLAPEKFQFLLVFLVILAIMQKLPETKKRVNKKNYQKKIK